MVNDATIARRMASQFWGEVQRQKKLLDGIWTFSTAGHGGFIVDVDKYPELAEYKSTVYINAKSNYYYPSEQHFAAFEEDCEYAKVIWAVPRVLIKLAGHYSINQDRKQWAKEMMKSVRTSLEYWNPDFLVKHPEPGFADKL